MTRVESSRIRCVHIATQRISPVFTWCVASVRAQCQPLVLTASTFMQHPPLAANGENKFFLRCGYLVRCLFLPFAPFFLYRLARWTDWSPCTAFLQFFPCRPDLPEGPWRAAPCGTGPSRFSTHRQVLILEAVCRHPTKFCSLRDDNSGPFLDLPPLRSLKAFFATKESAAILKSSSWNVWCAIFSMSSQFVTITVLNGMLRRQDTTFALRLVTNMAVLMIHADHDAFQLTRISLRKDRARSSVSFNPPFVDRKVVFRAALLTRTLFGNPAH